MRGDGEEQSKVVVTGGGSYDGDEGKVNKTMRGREARGKEHQDEEEEKAKKSNAAYGFTPVFNSWQGGKETGHVRHS